MLAKHSHIIPYSETPCSLSIATTQAQISTSNVNGSSQGRILFSFSLYDFVYEGSVTEPS